MKKYLPVAILAAIIVFFVYLGLFLSTLAVLRGQNRLEEDLMVIQSNFLQQEATSSATPSASPKFRPATISGELR